MVKKTFKDNLYYKMVTDVFKNGIFMVIVIGDCTRAFIFVLRRKTIERNRDKMRAHTYWIIIVNSSHSYTESAKLVLHVCICI